MKRTEELMRSEMSGVKWAMPMEISPREHKTNEEVRQLAVVEGIEVKMINVRFLPLLVWPRPEKRERERPLPEKSYRIASF